jgi:hypothetical protein
MSQMTVERACYILNEIPEDRAPGVVGAWRIIRDRLSVVALYASHNTQSAFASQIADEIEKVLSFGAKVKPEDLQSYMVDWCRQLRTL